MLRAQDAKPQLARALGNYGVSAARLGDVATAVRCFSEALEMDESAGYKEGIARHLYNWALLDILHGEHAEALARLERAGQLLESVGAHGFKTTVDIDRAEALLNLGRFGEAAQVAGASMADMVQMGHRDHILQAQIILAKAEAAAGDPNAAVAALQALLAVTGHPDEQAALHFELWQLGEGDDHATSAAALYREIYERQPFYATKLRLEALEEAGVTS